MRTAATDRMDGLDPAVGPEAGAAPVLMPAPVAVGEPSRSRAAATRRCYAADWAAFQAWCRTETRHALPATAASVAAYLEADAAKRRPGTLRRRLAAISDKHRQLGHAVPVDAAVRNILHQARRHAAPNAPPPSAARLAGMAAACPGDLAGMRDRALLGLAAATGLGRAALIALDVEDLRFDAASVTLRTRGRAADALVDDALVDNVTVARRLPVTACPVHALADWLLVSDTGFGPVFRKIDRWGNVEHRRLGTDALRRIWLRRALPADRA